MDFNPFPSKFNWMLVSLLLLTACARENPSFSLLSDSQGFQQSASSINNKVDVLWVVDNSGSMGPLQTNMVNNFNSFISNFVTKGYDFRLAVTTSDAYLAAANFDNWPTMAQFRDGLGANLTGVFVIDPLTPNLIPTFVTNASQGEAGSGDERVFSSMREALNSNLNAGFLRPDSYFAVVILSDEDDFSGNRPEGSWLDPHGVPDHDYTWSGLDTVDSYVSYLDQLTGSTPSRRRYNVSAITVLDNTCLNAHKVGDPATIIGQRYMDIANKTNGALGSICDASYSNSLAAIEQNILELNSQFYLTRTPAVSTIVITVNGVNVPQSSTNGWTYDAATNSIMFHGSAVPPAGAAIAVNFDPTTPR